MRKAHVVYVLLALAGCSKQESQAPAPAAAKLLLDGDTPIIISDTSGFPGGEKVGRPLPGGTTALYMQTVPLFSSWPNNGPSGKLTELYPSYSTFDGVQITVSSNTPPTASYCTTGQECHIKIWYEDKNNPTIFFDYNPHGAHALVLKSTQNAFDKYINWASATNGNNIVNPTSTDIKKIEVFTTGKPTDLDCSTTGTLCTVLIQVK